eukprot:6862656-Prymnesium_polylepis.1
MHPIDWRVHPLDWGVHPIDWGVHPIDWRVHVHPINSAVHPLDWAVHPIDWRVHHVHPLVRPTHVPPIAPRAVCAHLLPSADRCPWSAAPYRARVCSQGSDVARALNRQEWFQCLIRIAVMRRDALNPRATTTVADELQTLIQVPRAPRGTHTRT